jgi:hypothetical protein
MEFFKPGLNCESSIRIEPYPDLGLGMLQSKVGYPGIVLER